MVRFHIVTIKTLKDISTARRVIPILAFTLGLPIFIFFILSLPPNVGATLSQRSLETQFRVVKEFFLLFSFIWISGISLVLITGTTTAGFVAKESSERTLSILISKPIRRWEILLGKFIGFLIVGIIIQAVALISAAHLMCFLFRVDAVVLEMLLSLAFFTIPYAVFIMMLFGTIGMALSTIFDSPFKASMGPVLLIILVYFGFFIIRSVASGMYEDYQFYHLDLGYHLGNVFIMFLTSSGITLPPSTQQIFGVFTGVYQLKGVVDTDQGIASPSLPLTPYYTPIMSLALWLGISIGLLFAGIFFLKKKEVH